jgi:hypothetical protein
VGLGLELKHRLVNRPFLFIDADQDTTQHNNEDSWRQQQQQLQQAAGQQADNRRYTSSGLDNEVIFMNLNILM